MYVRRVRNHLNVVAPIITMKTLQHEEQLLQLLEQVVQRMDRIDKHLAELNVISQRIDRCDDSLRAIANGQGAYKK